MALDALGLCGVGVMPYCCGSGCLGAVWSGRQGGGAGQGCVSLRPKKVVCVFVGMCAHSHTCVCACTRICAHVRVCACVCMYSFCVCGSGGCHGAVPDADERGRLCCSEGLRGWVEGCTCASCSMSGQSTTSALSASGKPHVSFERPEHNQRS